MEHAPERQNGATMCHVEQPIQHGGPRNLVESAQPMFAETLEHSEQCTHSLHAWRARTDEERWPSRRLSQSAAQSFSKPISPCNNPSHTPIWLPQCRQAPNSD